jgi:membrane protein implicated in regulation of membrane protease activity
MDILRYVLLLTNLAGAGFTFWLVGTVDGTPTAEIVASAAGAVFALNFFYLFRLPSETDSKSSSRIGRLIGLWFEAKERELQNRGNVPPHSN